VTLRQDHRIEDLPDPLADTPDDADRKFWTGKKRLTLLQGIGIALVLTAVTAVVFGYGVRISLFVLGPLVVFAVMGNLLARRKKQGLH